MSKQPDPPIYLIFKSIHYVMQAEELLLEAEIPVEMVPTPRELSSDCGMCLTCSQTDLAKIKTLLSNGVAGFESEIRMRI